MRWLYNAAPKRVICVPLRRSATVNRRLDLAELRALPGDLKRLTSRPDLYELILVKAGRILGQLDITFHPLIGLSEHFIGMGHANFTPYLSN